MNLFNFSVKTIFIIIMLGIIYLASAFVNLTWNPVEFGTWTRVVDVILIIYVFFKAVVYEIKY